MTLPFVVDSVPEGTAGEVMEVMDDEQRLVRFPACTETVPPPNMLLLASPEQAAQWETTKAELDAKAATLTVVAQRARASPSA